MLHAGLCGFGLFQLDVELFKFGFCATKLRDCLVVVHLLDLVVLELLLVKLLLSLVYRPTSVLLMHLGNGLQASDAALASVQA